KLDRRLDSADSTLLLSALRSERGLSCENLVGIASYQSAIATDDFRMAFHSLTECLARDSLNEEALELLAVLSGYVGDLGNHVASLRRLVDLHPDEPELLLSFARA